MCIRDRVTTLTKKMAEDLTDYLSDHGVKVKYMHHEVDTFERVELMLSLIHISLPYAGELLDKDNLQRYREIYAEKNGGAELKMDLLPATEMPVWLTNAGCHTQYDSSFHPLSGRCRRLYALLFQ